VAAAPWPFAISSFAASSDHSTGRDVGRRQNYVRSCTQ
jgi:hypothetical protein